MEQLHPAKRKPVVRRSRQQILKLLKEYNSTQGVSVADYCKMHKVNKSNFYNWQKRYGLQCPVPAVSQGFVPLQLPSSLSTAGNVSSLFAEVNGIRLYQVVAPDYLKALLS